MVRAVVAGLVAFLALTACSGGSNEEPPAQLPGTPRTAVTDLDNVLQLRGTFNDDRGVPRLILLLSPT